jgi:hypothetical protein
MPRPVPVTVVAAFLFLATAIAAVVGFSLLFPNPLTDRMWELNKPGAALFQSLGRAPGFFLLALGCGTLAAGLALLRGRKWGWWFALVLFIVDGAGDVAGYFLVHDALRAVTGVAVSSSFIYLLCRGDARRYFARARRMPLTPNHKT